MYTALLSTTTSLVFDLPLRPDSSGLAFVVKSPSGGTVQTSASATRNAVDTTVSGSVTAGATTLTLTSPTGVVVGRQYIVGNTSDTAASEDEGGEWVTVKGLVSSTATLTNPMLRSKTSGPLFQSTRITCAITGTNIATVGRHYRVEVDYKVGAVSQPTFVVPFDVVRYSPTSTLTLAGVQALDPVIGKRLPAGFWWPTFRDLTWSMVLERVAAKVDPGAIVGALNLTTAHAYLARAVLAETAGNDPDAVAYRELMTQRFNEQLEALGTMPVDNDQDGAIESNEGVSMHTIDLRRG